MLILNPYAAQKVEWGYCNCSRENTDVDDQGLKCLASNGKPCNFPFSVFFQGKNPFKEVEQLYRTLQYFVCSAKTDTTATGKLGRAVRF